MIKKLALLLTCIFLSGIVTAKQKPRAVFVTGEVSPQTIIPATAKLYSFASKSKKPIDIIINSPGGSVYAGLQFINGMRYAQANGIKLRCYVAGMAASMAFQILSECDKRYAMPYSLLLWHPMAIMVSRARITVNSAVEIAQEMDRIEKELIKDLKKSLAISDEVFYKHYWRESLLTGVEFVKHVNSSWLTIKENLPYADSAWSKKSMKGLIKSRAIKTPPRIIKPIIKRGLRNHGQ